MSERQTAIVGGAVVSYWDLTAPRLAGVVTRGDNIIIRHTQDIGDILYANKLMRKRSDANWSAGKEMKMAARIPYLEHVKLEQMGIKPGTPEYLRAIEARPEWKVTEKRLI